MKETDIEQVYDRIRAEESAARDARIRVAYALCPELADLRREQSLLMRAPTSLSGGAEQRFTELCQKRTALLASIGLPADELSMRYRCPVCHDTGYVGQPRRACACRLRYTADLMDGAGSVNAHETFENFNAGIYPSEPQKKQASNAMRYCLAFADSLPAPVFPNLLLLGESGLGKSYLCNAVARRAIERGCTVQKCTAYGFVSDMLRDIDARSSQQLAACISADLLVLDDLGTEPMIPKITVERLFCVLNERCSRRRPTVVATNLSVAAMQELYGERIFSRLCDQSLARILALTGKNLRMPQS